MKQLAKALILSTSCFLLASCETQVKREVAPLNVKAESPEHFVCPDRPARPSLPPGHIISWADVEDIEQAKAEVEALMQSMLDRNGIVSSYILDLEGAHFVCWNNMQWQNDFYDNLEQ